MAGRVGGEEATAFGEAQPIQRLSYSPGVVDTAMQGEIRSQPAEQFPLLGHFTQLHTSGQLVPPEAPAQEIADWLDQPLGADVPPFSEARLGG